MVMTRYRYCNQNENETKVHDATVLRPALDPPLRPQQRPALSPPPLRYLLLFTFEAQIAFMIRTTTEQNEVLPPKTKTKVCCAALL